MKYGGNAMGRSEASDSTLEEILDLHSSGVEVVLVHGGGPEIDRQLLAHGIVTRRIDGLRYTDARTLEITEAALCGTVNKQIVRASLALGIPAIGMSGEDAALLVAERVRSAAGEDLGFVGNITACQPAVVLTLLASGYVPVIAPLALSADGRSALNVNADLSAAAIAVGIRARAFIAITNVSRVLQNPDDPASGVDRFSLAEARQFVASSACRSSMRPKLHAAIHAVHGGVAASYICAASPGAIRAAFNGDATVIADS